MYAHFFCVKYTDDISLLYFVTSQPEDNLLIEWDHVTEWSNLNYLPVNLSKSCVMDVVTKKSSISYLSLSEVAASWPFL